MKSLRAIRFDASDTFVFETAAAAEEWVVSGASTYAGMEPGELRGKLRQAFANGFLGTTSLGHSTFAVVARTSEDALVEARAALAKNLEARLGALPDVALQTAADEIAYASALCEDLEPGTVLAVVRRRADDGRITEQYRRISRPLQATATAGSEAQHARIWTIVDDGD